MEQQASSPLRYFSLRVSPCGVGASMDIDLEVFVNRSTAPDLNSGKERIEEILVLHLERGKDYFISVTGNYLPSCFGTSIRSLCQMREPIQDMPAETLRKLVSGTSSIHVHRLLLSPHSVSSLDSALRDNLSCFFASSLFVRLNTCGGVLRRLTAVSWQKHWHCRLSKLSLLSTPGRYAWQRVWKAARHSKRTLDDGGSLVPQCHQTGQKMCSYFSPAVCCSLGFVESFLSRYIWGS